MADEARSHLTYETADKVMSTQTPTIEWMTADLADHLLSMFHAAGTKLQMQLLRRGVEPDDARASAGQQMALLAFQLGIQVGSELEAGRAFREMFGDNDG